MHLIADSGSTKTTWALIEKETVKKTVLTAGLNPYFHTSESVEAILMADLVPEVVPDDIREIYFYGAGCSTENKNALLKDSMKIFFRQAAIFIFHDILGAARALLGRQEGIACILGTGCNSCYFDGENIRTGVPSLGYIFGDEGAGSNIGKRFMEKYLKDKLPKDLKQQFDTQYNLTLEDILNSLYNRPYPNRFLASFSEFIAPRQQHPFLKEMVRSSLMAFFDEQVKRYENYREVPVSFVGSIAFHYRELLIEAAKDNKVRIGKILQSPMEGLVDYHKIRNIS
jgi:glucosamine kinase